jgi:peptidoglycan/xylan/chitin deacetylase (PgdA/CDA1 family)
MVRDGHYLGPHSDHHPLYAPWEDRKKTLVTEEEFRADLQQNIDDLRGYGALRETDRPIYFIPPYEWYNADQVRWSRPMGVLLFNFTPGSGSNRDWAPEGHKSFVPSRKILEDVLAYEQWEERGLNGFLLLLHLGSQRQDKFHVLIPQLLDQLKSRGYVFVRVDEMLR